MTLVRTIQKCREMLRMSALSNNNSIPDIESVEELQLIPLIGQTLYDHLDTNYTAIENADPATVYTKLLKKIQKAVVPLAYLRDLATMHVLITDGGVRTMSSSNMEAAHSWEYKALQNALLEKGMVGVELMLQFLEANKDDIAQWTSDPAYTKYRRLMIRNALTFADMYPIYQPYRTFSLLKPIMHDVEESYLVADIGRDLLAFLRTQDTMPVEAEGGEIDVITVVQKAVANFTIKHAIKRLTVRFNEHGFTVMSTGDIERSEVAGRTGANGNEYEMQLRDADQDGQNWLARSKKYLRGIADGTYNNDWGEDFTNAFENSPLNSSNNPPVLERGNGGRRIFIF